MSSCMEGVVAVSRHLLGAMWRKPSAEFKIMAKWRNSKAAPVSKGQVRLRAVFGWNGVFPSCQVLALTDKRAKILFPCFSHIPLPSGYRSW